MRRVSACARARVQSRLSTAAAPAALFSNVLREVGIAFLPGQVSSFLRLSLFFRLAKYLKDAPESQHAAPICLRNDGWGLNVLAAVDMDFRAVHVRTGLRAQHVNDLRHLVGSAQPVQRNLLFD